MRGGRRAGKPALVHRASVRLLALPVKLQCGPGGFRPQPEETGKALIEPLLRHAAATGLQSEYGPRGFPRQVDGLGKDKQLFRFVLNQHALDQPDRKIAHDRKRDRGSVETSLAREDEQSRLVKLSKRMQPLYVGQRLRMLAGAGAHRCLDGVGCHGA